jgi:hypothetical protein
MQRNGSSPKLVKAAKLTKSKPARFVADRSKAIKKKNNKLSQTKTKS